MGQKTFASPQFKITCKRISPKVNIESVDKKFANEYKNLLDKYELVAAPIAFYDGAVDEHGYAKDTHDYYEWKNSHPDVISKKSINNLFRKIKNKSRLDYSLNGVAKGTVFNAGFIEGNNFKIQIVHTSVDLGVGTILDFTIMYYNNKLSVEIVAIDIDA